MAEFVLKNSYFEFDSSVIGNAIETKFASPYECTFMDEHMDLYMNPR